jgi:hypothetical protein
MSVGFDAEKPGSAMIGKKISGEFELSAVY